MKKRKIIVSLFALLGLASCWEDVEVELDLGEPQLAVSDIGLAAGEKIRIAISPDPVVNWDSVQPFYEQTHARPPLGERAGRDTPSPPYRRFAPDESL